MRHTILRPFDEMLHAALSAVRVSRRRMGYLALAVASTAASALTLPPPPVSPAPVAKYEYDAEGNATKITVAPTTRAYVTQQGYDSLSRLTRTTDAKNGLTQFGYDLQGQLTSVTDPRSLVTQYQPTGLGDVKQLTSPDTGIATSTYDAAGNLKTRIDARGVLATYSYDALNRLKQVVYSRTGDANRTLTWTYDQTGGDYGSGIRHLTSTATPNANTTFQYDQFDRVTKIVQINAGRPSLAVVYGYTGSHLTQITYPSGRIVWFGWANGQPQSTGVTILGATNTVVTLFDQAVMSPTGAVQSWNWRLGMTGKLHERIFDTSGRVVRYPLGPLVRDITYDDADRISRYTHYTAANAQPAPAYDQAFSYDELDRLQLVTAATNWSYAYDANGNRTASSAGANARSYSVSTTSNRLDALTNPVRNMGYDPAGNTLSDTQSGSSANYTATYSLEGRLASMVQGSAAGVDFGYDGLGRRTSRSQWTGSPTNPRTVTRYAYDQDNHLLGEYTADGVPITEYMWFGDIPVGIVKTDPAAPSGIQVYAIHTDHLYTPRVIVDAQGQVRWRWMGEPFGSSPAEEQPTAGLAALQQNLRFPGQQYEPFGGRHYNHFRDYDPATGRYVQSDPIGLQGGINQYAYVGGNPVSFVDPYGLRDVDVYIWRAQISPFSVGHVMITEANSTQVILSQFPANGLPIGSNQMKSFTETMDDERRSPAEVWRVNVPNDREFDAAAARERGLRYWTADTADSTTQCSIAASRALRAGGVNINTITSGTLYPGLFANGIAASGIGVRLPR